jgi:c-di-AMP phosphodiesterase-like protein
MAGTIIMLIFFILVAIMFLASAFADQDFIALFVSVCIVIFVVVPLANKAEKEDKESPCHCKGCLLQTNIPNSIEKVEK